MIGVVVWSSEPREKAIIWFEDHGALAYLQGREDLTTDSRWPANGDLLELSSETIGNIRHARHVSLLNDKSCPAIPALLDGPVIPQPRLRLVASQDEASRSLRECEAQSPIVVEPLISAAG